MKNKYGELRSGFSLILLTCVMILCPILLGLIGSLFMVAVRAITSAMMNPEAAAFGYILSDGTELTGIFLSSLLYLIMTAAILLLFKITYKRPLKEMGLSRKNFGREFIFGCLFGVLLITSAFVILLVTGHLVIDSLDLSVILSAGMFGGFIQFILVGFFEEILSRGYIMTALKTTRNKYVIMFSSSVIFSVLHLANNGVTLLSLVNIFLVGLVFALLFIKTGRLWAPIGMHITWNFFQGNVFGINVSGMDTVSVINSRFAGSDIITGGSFGAEGGVVVTAVMLLALAFIHFKLREPEDKDWTFDSGLPFAKINNEINSETVDEAIDDKIQ